MDKTIIVGVSWSKRGQQSGEPEGRIELSNGYRLTFRAESVEEAERRVKEHLRDTAAWIEDALKGL